MANNKNSQGSAQPKRMNRSSSSEWLTGFAVVLVVSAAPEAVTGLNFEPLTEPGGAILKEIFE